MSKLFITALIMLALARSLGFGFAVLRYKTHRVSRDMRTSASIMVDGLQCDEVTVRFPPNAHGVEEITILEANAASQEALVDRALDLEAKGSDGDPYGSVLWPAAKTVANRLLGFDKDELRKMTVLELGSGTGLVALTAAMCGCPKVIATDFNPFALRALEQAVDLQTSKQPIPFGVISTLEFDVKDLARPLPTADLLLIADLLYNPETGDAVARRIYEAVQRGTRVIIADSPGRPGRPQMLSTLSLLMKKTIAFTTVPGEAIVGLPRHELIAADPTSTNPAASIEPLEMALLEL